MTKHGIALAIAVLLVGFATAGDAATVSLTTDKSTYSVGEPIVLTVTADSEGEAMIDVAIGVTYDTTMADAGAAATQSAYNDPFISLNPAVSATTRRVRPPRTGRTQRSRSPPSIREPSSRRATSSPPGWVRSRSGSG